MSSTHILLLAMPQSDGRGRFYINGFAERAQATAYSEVIELLLVQMIRDSAARGFYS